MFCTKCGRELQPGQAFCSKCGARVGSCGGDGAPGAPSFVKVALGYYVMCWKKCLRFTGRSARSEFWYFTLVHFLILLVLGFIVRNGGDEDAILLTIYHCAGLLPFAAASTRRLHDVGQPGKIAFQLLFAVGLTMKFSHSNEGWLRCLPIVVLIGGLIVLTVFWAQDSQTNENEYGPNPNAPPVEDSLTQDEGDPDEENQGVRSLERFERTAVSVRPD